MSLLTPEVHSKLWKSKTSLNFLLPEQSDRDNISLA